MTSESLIHQPFSIENLQALLQISDAFASLPAAEKQNIQEHLKLKNISVLIYIYGKLQEEQQSYQIIRDRLAQKISNLSLHSADRQDLTKDLKQTFQK